MRLKETLVGRLFTQVPGLADPDRTLIARQVFFIVRAFVVSSVFLQIVQIALAPKVTGRWLIMLLATVCVSLTLLELNRRGHVRSASFMLVVSLWLLVSIFAWMQVGLGTRAAWGYFIVVFIAGMVLGKWPGIITAGVCSASTLLIAVEAPFRSSDPIRFWLINTLFLIVVLLLQDLAGRSIREALSSARQELHERQKTEEALRVQNQFISTLLRAIPVAVFFKDKDGRYTGCNDAFTEIMGFTAEEIKGKTVFELWPSALAETYHQKDLELMRSRAHQVYEYQIKDRFGQLRPVIYAKDVILNPDGEVSGLVGAFLDITERKKLEGQLLQAQKMEAVGILAGGVAHDFNNILSTILGYGSLLQMKFAEESPQKEYVERILIASERAANLTSSLLAFSRKQEVELQPLDLNDAIRGFHKILARLIGEDIEVRIDLASHTLTVDADVRQIEQVLMNLATNSRDAMPQGGRLTISTQAVEFDQDAGEIPRGSYAAVIVADNGSGMATDVQTHIFEPFFTTKEIGKGTGLGLAIVYGIVKKHSGFLTVASVPGQGTTFTIYLPLKPATMKEMKRRKREKIPSGNETILLVEDDPAVRQVTRTMLEEFGYTVLEAVDGVSAQFVFQEHRQRIDLVVCDLLMPRLNGRETLAGLRKMNAGIPAIFISGYAADVIANKGLADPGDHLLMKPLNPAVLLRAVRAVLDGA